MSRKSLHFDTSYCNEMTPIYCFMENQNQWFLMRASYGQEEKACRYLREQGLKVFLPKWKKERIRNGKKTRIEVSMIPNTLFVYSNIEQLHGYIGKEPISFFHHYYETTIHKIGSGVSRKPIIVPTSQMNSFMLWVGIEGADKIYKDGKFNFPKGALVRVIDGDFAGFTGNVVRYKGQTRVGISIDNIGTIFTAYIPKSLLVKISN